VPTARGQLHRREPALLAGAPDPAGRLEGALAEVSGVRILEGRTVLVTGAASGIGRSTALACARRRACVVDCDRDAAGLVEAERELRALGGAVLARPVDVASRDEMRTFAENPQLRP
jgi:FlaA1/EpsC-like NDP-sugar epimerase